MIRESNEIVNSEYRKMLPSILEKNLRLDDIEYIAEESEDVNTLSPNGYYGNLYAKDVFLGKVRYKDSSYGINMTNGNQELLREIYIHIKGKTFNKNLSALSMELLFDTNFYGILYDQYLITQGNFILIRVLQEGDEFKSMFGGIKWALPTSLKPIKDIKEEDITKELPKNLKISSYQIVNKLYKNV